MRVGLDGVRGAHPDRRRDKTMMIAIIDSLRRNALGFLNLAHYRIRSLLHRGNLTRQIDAL
jgi:hypothetical protein